MDSRICELLEARDSSDGTRAYDALVELFRITEQPVDWAYSVWDQLLSDLKSADNHKRSFAAQMLARLAISDPEQRMQKDFSAIANVMRDDRFVTARHALQSIWRIGLAGPEQLAQTLNALQDRFRQCSEEKNASLIRTDVITGLRSLADAVGDNEIGPLAEKLIASEPDSMAQAKQRAAWRKKRR